MRTTDPGCPMSQPKGLGQWDTWQAAAGRDSGTPAGQPTLKDLAARVCEMSKRDTTRDTSRDTVRDSAVPRGTLPAARTTQAVTSQRHSSQAAWDTSVPLDRPRIILPPTTDELAEVDSYSDTLGPRRWWARFRYRVRRSLGDSHGEALELVVMEAKAGGYAAKPGGVK